MAAKKVLVVDDDPDIRDVIMYILKSEGYQVSGLDNGREVIKTAKEIQPNIILLNVQLGDADGRDICRALKQQPETQGLPIIMISANHGWHALHEKQCQAEDFLAKPFDIEDLVDHVRRFAA